MEVIWKPKTEIPTDHWERNPSISSEYLVNADMMKMGMPSSDTLDIVMQVNAGCFVIKQQNLESLTFKNGVMLNSKVKCLEILLEDENK